MAEQENIAQIRELFNAYVANLNQEFHDHTSAKVATDECMRIAVDLMEYGFVILIQTEQSVKTIQPTDDTVQTIITFEYDMALVKHEIPMQVPIAVANATTRVFGPAPPYPLATSASSRPFPPKTSSGFAMRLIR